jgi:hypothetical protein
MLEISMCRLDRSVSPPSAYQLSPVDSGDSLSEYKWMETSAFAATWPIGHRFPKECGQQMMDDLWACGIRPSDGTGNVGALQAVQQNAADLRALLFHKEGIALK